MVVTLKGLFRLIHLKVGTSDWSNLEIYVAFATVKCLIRVHYYCHSPSTPTPHPAPRGGSFSHVLEIVFPNDPSLILISGQSYKHFTLVNYNSRVLPDWKIPHIMTLES